MKPLLAHSWDLFGFCINVIVAGVELQTYAQPQPGRLVYCFVWPTPSNQFGMIIPVGSTGHSPLPTPARYNITEGYESMGPIHSQGSPKRLLKAFWVLLLMAHALSKLYIILVLVIGISKNILLLCLAWNGGESSLGFSWPKVSFEMLACVNIAAKSFLSHSITGDSHTLIALIRKITLQVKDPKEWSMNGT